MNSNLPTARPKIAVNDFFFGVIYAAVLAGLAILPNPVWPVVIGVVKLCALVVVVLRCGWVHGILATEVETTAAANRGPP